MRVLTLFLTSILVKINFIADTNYKTKQD